VPIETVTVLLMLFCLHVHNPKTPFWTGIKAIDWYGAISIAGATILFLIGLQFGGISYPWSSPVIICLIIIGILLFFLFFYTQYYVSPYPIMPFTIFAHRSTLSALAVTFFDAFVFNAVAFFLPLYYQTVLETSPIRSGVLMLPMALPLSAISVSAGWIMERTGRYVELLRGGLLLMTLSTGLLVSLPTYLDLTRLIPFLIILGIGFGPNFHAPLLALQAKLQPTDMAAGTATFSFVRMLSGAIGIVLCQVVYQSDLKIQLHAVRNFREILGDSVTSALENGSAISSTEMAKLDKDKHDILRKVTTTAMSRVWILLCCASFLGLMVSMGIERQKLKRQEREVPEQSRVSSSGTDVTKSEVSRPVERIEMV
jgi:hypothetical protein